MKRCLTGSATLLAFLSSPFLAAQDQSLTELDAFITEEVAAEDSDSLLPTDRTVDSVLFANMSLLDLPRSVSVISPEVMAQYQIDDVYDLPSVVPGASVTNYYGVPGIPTTRGLFTSIYFNGMQRVWNRNGYPTSFGSLEAMDYAKGPPPPFFSAASPGGFVNFIPKSPFFDQFRGSVKLTVGSYEKYRSQIDVGGPVLLGETPVAYRLSVTMQEADSYYDGIFNDYVSVYGSFKARLSETWSIFGGGEYYRHRSKENPGWNRVTQDLIDHGDYIVGRPLTDLTGDSFTIQIPGVDGPTTFVNTTPGFVNRAALETATPFGGTRGSFDGSFLALSGFANSGFRIENFGPEATAFLSTLGGIDNPGAGVTTVKIDGSTVLTSPNDFADADTYLAFLDFIFDPSSDFKVTFKTFIDAYEREKVSDYGYGEYGENFTIEEKVLLENTLHFDAVTVDLAYGASIRYEDSIAKTEFTVEPFSRRDITAGPGLNDTLFSGGQRDVNGNTFWDPFGSWDTQLTTVGAFLNTRVAVTEAFSIIGGVRVDKADWDRAVPFDLGADFNSGEKEGGDKTYTNFSISPTLKLSDSLSVYYTYQKGTAFQGFYVSGSVSEGDQNFQESSLHEVGVRGSLLDDRLYLAATYFSQELVDFDDRGGIAIPQEGEGVEFEFTYVLSERVTVRGNLTWQEHHFLSDTIPGGFVPLTDEQFVDFAGIFYADFGGRPNPGGPRHGIPEWSGSLFVKWDLGGGFGISGGPHWVESMYANPDKTLKLPSYLEWNGNLYYKAERWDLMVSAKNITSEDYFHPFDAFAANAIILKAEPITVDVTLTIRF